MGITRRGYTKNEIQKAIKYSVAALSMVRNLGNIDAFFGNCNSCKRKTVFISKSNKLH